MNRRALFGFLAAAPVAGAAAITDALAAPAPAPKTVVLTATLNVDFDEDALRRAALDGWREMVLKGDIDLIGAVDEPVFARGYMAATEKA